MLPSLAPSTSSPPLLCPSLSPAAPRCHWLPLPVTDRPLPPLPLLHLLLNTLSPSLVSSSSAPYLLFLSLSSRPPLASSPLPLPHLATSPSLVSSSAPPPCSWFPPLPHLAAGPLVDSSALAGTPSLNLFFSCSAPSLSSVAPSCPPPSSSPFPPHLPVADSLFLSLTAPPNRFLCPRQHPLPQPLLILFCPPVVGRPLPHLSMCTLSLTLVSSSSAPSSLFLSLTCRPPPASPPLPPFPVTGSPFLSLTSRQAPPFPTSSPPLQPPVAFLHFTTVVIPTPSPHRR